MKNIIEARDRFVEAAQTYEVARKKVGDLELDVLIAQREERDPTQAEKALARFRSEEWYPAYKERQIAAAALLDELGIRVEDLKGAVA
jgi:hypothetical protein